MNNDYLNELNAPQRQAVTTTEGPILVIAGAGSGKTRVITYRIAHMIYNGVHPSAILALTFTNKAAGEMKERIGKITTSQTARYLWMGTFHSIFSKILRAEAARLGYTRDFTIYDANDSRSLVRTIIKERQLDDKIYKPNSIAARISDAKNNLITANIYYSDNTYHEFDKANKIPEFAEIYKTYSERCLRSNAMDFDDLLLNTNILFRDYPDVLAQYQQKFQYIFVDEYQDTNYAQYLIIKKLSAKHHNICVVGDDAQSIYSFRGARIENILNFKKDYPECRVFKLEQNYRSTQTIVNAANGVIANNKDQLHKVVFSKNEPGEKITVIGTYTDLEEASSVASNIFDKRLANRLQWSDFAILYRTNAQSRLLEEALRKKFIPYKIYGGLSFYERKEIKDLLSYFRLVVNKKDDEALKRIINYPKRGIGDTTIAKITEVAKNEQIPIWDILQNIEKLKELFNGTTLQKLILFVSMINDLAAEVETANAWDIATKILERSTIKKEIGESKTPEDISRVENIEELMNGIKVFVEEADTNGDPNKLSDYLSSVALLTDQDNEKEEDLNKVTLMTIHSAKGLEFNQIYITGMEDTIFPSPLSLDSLKEIEEERRLFYVALTRAEKEVTLSYAMNRYKWGNLEVSNPSRFLKELDQSLLRFINTPQPRQTKESFYSNDSFDDYSDNEFFDPKHRFGGYRSSSNNGSIKSGMPNRAQEERARINTNNNLIRKTNLKKIEHAQSSTPSSVSSSGITVGAKVTHERFGKGVVVAIEGMPPNDTASVDFETVGIKKLLLRFAKLTLS